MAVDFPNSPSDGDTVTIEGKTFTFSDGAWRTVDGILTVVGAVGPVGPTGEAGAPGAEYTQKIAEFSKNTSADVTIVTGTEYDFTNFTQVTNEFTTDELVVDLTNGTFTVKEDGFFFLGISMRWGSNVNARHHVLNRIRINDNNACPPAGGFTRSSTFALQDEASSYTGLYTRLSTDDVIRYTYQDETSSATSASHQIDPSSFQIIRLYKYQTNFKENSMADITDPEAIRFVNEYIRPMAEQIRYMTARGQDFALKWQDLAADFPDLDTDILQDGRENQGVSRLNGQDINAMAQVILSLLTVMDEPTQAVVSKPCVRPLLYVPTNEG